MYTCIYIHVHKKVAELEEVTEKRLEAFEEGLSEGAAARGALAERVHAVEEQVFFFLSFSRSLSRALSLSLALLLSFSLSLSLRLRAALLLSVCTL